MNMEKQVTISIRVPSDVKDAINEDAAAQDQIQAEWLRDAIESYLAMDDIRDESESYDFTDYKNLIEHQIEKIEDLDDTDDVVKEFNDRFDDLKERIEDVDDLNDDDLLDLMNDAQDLLDDCRNESGDSDEDDQEEDEANQVTD
jgi:predicted DNA-binding protein